MTTDTKLDPKSKEKLEFIKGRIQQSHEYFSKNYERFNEMRNILYKSSISKTEEDVLKETQKPVLEFNILEAYVSRLVGEFYKQQPSVSVSSDDVHQIPTQMLNLLEDHARYVIEKANKDGFSGKIYKDLLTGGFSAAKIVPKYKHHFTFQKELMLERVYHPTLVGFDWTAKLPSKVDGNFCFEIVPMRKEDAESIFPDLDFDRLQYSDGLEGFKWAYRNNKNEKMLMVAYYYEKEFVRTTIIEDAEGNVMTLSDYNAKQKQHILEQKTEVFPDIVYKRVEPIEKICKYTLIKNEILDYEETDYPFFNLIFFDGNSALLQQPNGTGVEFMTRPYIYHAVGTQKLKNFAGSCLGNELENMVQHKYAWPLEGIPGEYLADIKNIQNMSLLPYRQYDQKEPTRQFNPPTVIPRQPIPPEISSTFELADKAVQNILGSYDASLGINNNQLSGVAIVEGATQSNAAAMPYIMGFMNGLNQALQFYISYLPKIVKRNTKLTVMSQDGRSNTVDTNGMEINYIPWAPVVKIDATVSFAIQKNQTLQQLVSLAQAIPAFGEFIQSKGLEVIVDNLEIRGKDELKDLAAEFVRQQQQSQGAPNPQMMQMQQEMQLKNQDFSQKQQKMQLDAAIEAHKNTIKEQENQIKMLQIMLEAKSNNANDVVQASKAATERFAKETELQIANDKHEHQKQMDHAEFAASHLKHQPKEESIDETT